MSVLVGNIEDRFSHNEAHLTADSIWHFKLMDRKMKLLFVLFGFLPNIIRISVNSRGHQVVPLKQPYKGEYFVVITLPISPYRNISCVK